MLFALCIERRNGATAGVLTPLDRQIQHAPLFVLVTEARTRAAQEVKQWLGGAARLAAYPPTRPRKTGHLRPPTAKAAAGAGRWEGEGGGESAGGTGIALAR